MEVKKDNYEDFVVQEERHRELIRTVKGLTGSFPKQEKIDLSSLSRIEQVISKLDASIQGLRADRSENTQVVGAIRDLATVVNTMNDNLTSQMVKLTLEIQQYNEPKEIEYVMHRSPRTEKITKVTAKQK